jgi:hypothetical protein
MCVCVYILPQFAYIVSGCQSMCRQCKNEIFADVGQRLPQPYYACTSLPHNFRQARISTIFGATLADQQTSSGQWTGGNMKVT